MRFGLSFLPDADPVAMPAAEYFASALELAAIADAEGLHTIKMTEHYLHPYGGYCPSPLGFFAGVAARTRHVRLMTGGVLPAFHHPIQLAAESAMIDAISGGRLDVGFARAYMPYEFAALGVPLDESRERFVASVEAVRRLWTEERVSIDSPFFSFRDATSLPRPTQSPHPPIWIAASLSPESFAWTGAHGYNLLTTFVLTERSHLKELLAIYRGAFAAGTAALDRAPRVALSIPLYVGESDTDAYAGADLYLGRYFAVWEDGATAWKHVESPAYRGYGYMADVIRASTPEHLRRTGGVVVGCPARVADRVAWLAAEFGVDEILWQVDFGAMPRELAMRNVRLFIDEVMPRL
jgi:alkanesulfonate monooxygenase SsuD/methylene tetrahydromethanopterin reductase-like flavin-dependent oxidoreductase (luciferase family)